MVMSECYVPRLIGKEGEDVFRVHLCGTDQRIVDAAEESDKNDTGNAYPHAETFASGRTESGNYAFFLILDEHGLHHQQIVVERDDGVDQRYQCEDVERGRTGLYSRREDEELAEESCKRRYTGE